MATATFYFCVPFDIGHGSVPFRAEGVDVAGNVHERSE